MVQQLLPKKFDLNTLSWWKFVDTSGKPGPYCRRMMGEVARIFGEPDPAIVWDMPKSKDLIWGVRINENMLG